MSKASEMLTRQQVEDLQRVRRNLPIITEGISTAFGSYESTDAAADIVRAKLAGHAERPVLWAVDRSSIDGEEESGYTICITGNGPKSQAHAEWISLLLKYGDSLIERCLWLETAVNDLDSRLTEMRGIVEALAASEPATINRLGRWECDVCGSESANYGDDIEHFEDCPYRRAVALVGPASGARTEAEA